MQVDDLKAWADACMSAARQCPREHSLLLLDMASSFLCAALEAEVETDLIPIPSPLLAAA
jgi:hypothetical protein